MLKNYTDDYIRINPTINDAIGLDDYKHLNNILPNKYSATYRQVNRNLMHTYLAAIQKRKRLTTHESILSYNLHMTIEADDKYNFDLIPITHLDNIYLDYFEMATGKSFYKFKKRSDYSDFLDRLKVFADITCSIIHQFNKGIVKGYVLPKIMTQLLIDQLNTLIRTSLTNPDAKFAKEAEGYLKPAMKQMVDYLRKVYLKQSRDTIGCVGLPNGKKEYEYLVRSNTSMKNVSVSEIHKYGMAEIKRIKTEMKKVSGSLSPEEYYKRIDNDPKYTFGTEKALLAHYDKIQKHVLDYIFVDRFKNTIGNKAVTPIKTVPKYNQAFSSDAYYYHGDTSGKRSGALYLNTLSLDTHKSFTTLSLFLHEAVPGHHFHITSINHNRSLPLYLKLINATAYYEGWGLYCENLYDYQYDAVYFGKLKLELLRATRLVLDTGIHHYGWSYKKALTFFQNNSFEEPKNLLSELQRYIADPGQALAYKMGEKVFLDLRKKFKGTDKQFHTKCIDGGPRPMFMLMDKR